MIPEKIQLYQALVAFIAIIMLYQSFAKLIKRDPQQSILKFLTRLTIWGGMGAVALFPSISLIVAKFIGIEGNVNAVVLIGFLLVFIMIFKLLSAIEKLEQKFSELVRQDALKGLKPKVKKVKGNK
ncbi:MAG: DUF2304 domain-containing protein [Patescibacteria group bacterium]|nr:DUF2304 domain-containing protein [Patescibacteria group bacterium]